MAQLLVGVGERFRSLETLELGLKSRKPAALSVTPGKLVSDLPENHRTARKIDGRKPGEAKPPRFRELSTAKVRHYHIAASAECHGTGLGTSNTRGRWNMDATRDQEITARALKASEDRLLPAAEAAVASQVFKPSRQTWQGPTPVSFLAQPALGRPAV
ncbi:hypothetical protein MAPG_05894 [Magnaporthiopsis poae ATCC 64411]|uniref:Uncharacterized protein n=1 Tax=Magnaporthiopsis poae (strain ATCC 64411 / 73-15) TaxID=644358 RepID=A0A0C4E0L4_MAGP6|nr:hypothetical protein MAPG_05894 [Magnaporthiopsis poae ATCC 64411]